ncbi:MAG: GAF domain-containing sensor histidine kinase [Nocardioides sp.]|uniref:sensor histidine kinase n=1 Tax=Nocardioides sp. TaxID=35761 RepID=UPI000C9757F0|nr:GAF domain-containing sensor histidine kinase [Nocardioides sp.]MAS56165.1 histidine kinase [Pimelobacter sp.]MDE0777585.1 GAF domain-containing sensor histidine kinase [Nocardioides sp.]
MHHRVIDHEHDAARMAELERYQVLSAEPRPELTALAELAARVCGVSSAFISVITDDELLQLASVGFEGFTVPRALSMCDAVLHEDEPLISSDLRVDPRFRDNPYVQQGRTVFYASYQLTSPAGVPFGSLCVFDDTEREIDDDQRRALRDLADRVVDVLELELRNRQLATAIDELERSNQQLAAFAGQVSHDLRNPLAAVTGNLELLEDLVLAAEPDVATMRGLISRAHRSTERMGRLVDEVLTFAVLGGRLDRHRVDVDALMREVREDLSSQLAGAAIEVGELPAVQADPVQLRIVLQNLVSNAAKYTRPGTTASISVHAEVSGATWRLAVVDHGLGVPPADRDRVFEPFVRVAQGLRVDGTGMGLPTCQRIVQAHGGRIGLDETPGGGATAWVELPAAPDA